MALTIIQLQDLIKNDSASEEDIKKILLTFCCKRFDESNKPHDVEYFLHNKAIEFEKHDIARTYLVFSSYQGAKILVGYYSLSNKPLIIAKKNFAKLSNSLKKRLMGFGHKTEQENYEIRGFLLGQLGKNYSNEAIKSKAVTGKDLLQLANDSMMISYKATGGRIFYLECEDSASLKEFYNQAGFREIESFKSPTGLCLFIRKIE